jgi:hypothetical protein
MDRVKAVPVRQAGQTVRLKESRLGQHRAARGPRLGFELQPGGARRLQSAANAVLAMSRWAIAAV